MGIYSFVHYSSVMFKRNNRNNLSLLSLHTVASLISSINLITFDWKLYRGRVTETELLRKFPSQMKRNLACFNPEFPQDRSTTMEAFPICSINSFDRNWNATSAPPYVLPFWWRFDDSCGGLNLEIYPKPNRNGNLKYRQNNVNTSINTSPETGRG